MVLMNSDKQMTKKRKFIREGIFNAEINNFLMRELAEDGYRFDLALYLTLCKQALVYSGVDIRKTPTRTEVIIRATRTQSVVGDRGRRIRELTELVAKRFGFPEGTLNLYAEKVNERGLCAVAQCESLRYKLVGGLAVRRACYGKHSHLLLLMHLLSLRRSSLYHGVRRKRL